MVGDTKCNRLGPHSINRLGGQQLELLRTRVYVRLAAPYNRTLAIEADMTDTLHEFAVRPRHPFSQGDAIS